MSNKIWTIFYKVDGIEKTYQIPAPDYIHALVRLGQIYGDKEGKEDRVIQVEKVM